LTRIPAPGDRKVNEGKEGIPEKIGRAYLKRKVEVRFGTPTKCAPGAFESAERVNDVKKRKNIPVPMSGKKKECQVLNVHNKTVLPQAASGDRRCREERGGKKVRSTLTSIQEKGCRGKRRRVKKDVEQA